MDPLGHVPLVGGREVLLGVGRRKDEVNVYQSEPLDNDLEDSLSHGHRPGGLNRTHGGDPEGDVMLELTIGSLAVLVLILESASTLNILVDIVAVAGASAAASSITATVAVAVTAGDSDDERHGSLKELLELEGVVDLLQPLGYVPHGGPGRLPGNMLSRRLLEK